MPNGVELATAYVSIVSETGSLAPSVTRALAPIPGIAGAAGAQGGRAIEQGMAGGLGRVTGAASKAGASAGKALSGGIGLGLKGLAAVGAALAVGDFIKDSIAEARESQKVGAITEQIIKSTGGAAKLTADQVGELATKISLKTGKDDEAIQSGANLLLTFKNVKNEVGDGANVFDRATAAAVDLSAAGFGSIEGSSKMLGKALNDPIKGISALSRAGVTFTQQQKDQIKVMVESGNVLGAQKIIMAEVESQVGGVGAASATAGEKASVAWANMKESLGTVLLPAIDWVMGAFTEFITFLMTNVPSAFKFVSDYIRPWVATVRDIISGFVGLAKAIWASFGRDIIAQAQAAWAFVKGVIDGGLQVIRGIIQVVTGLIKGDWKSVWEGLGKIVSGAWTIIKAAVQFILRMIGLVLDAGWTLIKKGVAGAWNGIASAISGVWNNLVSWISGPINAAKKWIQQNFIDKVNGFFETLHVGIRISPIWTAGLASPGARGMFGGSWESGGWTGNGPVNAIAGVVHGQEYVVKARSTRKIQKDYPGLLDALNGYAAGGWVNPVGVAAGFPWGRYPSGGRHPALDFPARRGTPIRFPMESGRVIRDGWDTGGFGVHVRTADSDGNYTILGHMLKEFVNVGDIVRQGQLVGLVDSSGNSTGDHLHMERRTSPGGGAFDFTRGGGGGNLVTNTIAAVIRSTLGGFGNLAQSGLSALGPWGAALGGVVKRALDGLISMALSAMGMEGGAINLAGTLDQGGWLAPGLNLAYNGLGRPEPVGDAIGGDYGSLADSIYEAARQGITDGMAERQRIERRRDRQSRGVTA